LGKNHRAVLDAEGAWFYARGQRSGWKVIYSLDERELKQLIVAWLAAKSVAPTSDGQAERQDKIETPNWTTSNALRRSR